MKRRFLIGALVIFTIFLGFFRDYLFIPINKLIETGNDPGGKLVITKWVLTALFTVVYLLITGVFLYILFRSFKYVLVSLSIYGSLIALSFIVFCIGYFFSSFQAVYPFIRTVMGIAQSPVILMVLIPACFLNESKLLGKKP